MKSLMQLILVLGVGTLMAEPPVNLNLRKNRGAGFQQRPVVGGIAEAPKIYECKGGKLQLHIVSKHGFSVKLYERMEVLGDPRTKWVKVELKEGKKADDVTSFESVNGAYSVGVRAGSEPMQSWVLRYNPPEVMECKPKP